MDSNRVFKHMFNIPRSGIYCLINHKKKMLYIAYSKDICTSLSRIVKDIKDKNIIYKQMIKDVKKLEFEYLEDINNCDTTLDIHLKLGFYIDKYKHLGYTLYNNRYKHLQLKVSIIPSNDLKFVHVTLVSKTYKRIVVGVFESIYEAQEFATVFDNMDLVKPIYAINDLTRNYLTILLDQKI